MQARGPRAGKDSPARHAHSSAALPAKRSPQLRGLQHGAGVACVAVQNVTTLLQRTRGGIARGGGAWPGGGRKPGGGRTPGGKGGGGWAGTEGGGAGLVPAGCCVAAPGAGPGADAPAGEAPACCGLPQSGVHGGRLAQLCIGLGQSALALRQSPLPLRHTHRSTTHSVSHIPGPLEAQPLLELRGARPRLLELLVVLVRLLLLHLAGHATLQARLGFWGPRRAGCAVSARDHGGHHACDAERSLCLLAGPSRDSLRLLRWAEREHMRRALFSRATASG